MFHCARRTSLLVLLALSSAAVIAHQLFAQTPVISTPDTYKEIVTLTTDSNGIHGKDPQSTLYTVPTKRTFVMTTLVIANDQDNYTDVLVKENSSRKIALIRVPQNTTISCEFPSGVEWVADSKVNVENLGGPSGTAQGDIHVTINGFLKKPVTT